MQPTKPFDYNRALNRLIRLRYEARRQGGTEPTPEIMELEREIYAHLRTKRTSAVQEPGNDA